jgi:hypothetical protein
MFGTCALITCNAVFGYDFFAKTDATAFAYHRLHVLGYGVGISRP